MHARTPSVRTPSIPPARLRRGTGLRAAASALCLAAALPLAGAQTPPSASGTAPQPAAHGIGAPSALYDDIDVAFGRADVNRDGRLTHEEARLLPAVDTRFDAIDTDHDRFISRAEFRRAVGEKETTP